MCHWALDGQVEISSLVGQYTRKSRLRSRPHVREPCMHPGKATAWDERHRVRQHHCLLYLTRDPFSMHDGPSQTPSVPLRTPSQSASQHSPPSSSSVGHAMRRAAPPCNQSPSKIHPSATSNPNPHSMDGRRRWCRIGRTLGLKRVTATTQRPRGKEIDSPSAAWAHANCPMSDL